MRSNISVSLQPQTVDLLRESEIKNMSKYINELIKIDLSTPDFKKKLAMRDMNDALERLKSLGIKFEIGIDGAADKSFAEFCKIEEKRKKIHAEVQQKVSKKDKKRSFFFSK